MRVTLAFEPISGDVEAEDASTEIFRRVIFLPGHAMSSMAHVPALVSLGRDRNPQAALQRGSRP